MVRDTVGVEGDLFWEGSPAYRARANISPGLVFFLIFVTSTVGVACFRALGAVIETVFKSG